MFDWNDRQRADLEALWRDPASDGGRERLASDLAAFCDKLGWTPDAAQLDDAEEHADEFLLTISAVPPELYILPWEVIHVGASGLYLSDYANAQVRYAVPGLEPRALQGSPDHPGVLLAWSAAGGAVPHEAHRTAIRDAAEAGGVTFHETPDVDERSLLTALDAKTPSVLHVLCRGVAGDAGEPPRITWGPTDDPYEITAPRLARLLRRHKETLRLVVLSVCGKDDGRGDGRGDPLFMSSLAQELHKKGVPTVVASRYPLSVSGSRVMVRALYDKMLREAWSLERALRHTREALFRVDDDGVSHPGDAYGLQLYAYDTERFVSDNDVEAERPVLATYPFGTPARPVPASGPPGAELTLGLDATPALDDDQLVDKLRRVSEDDSLTVTTQPRVGRHAVVLLVRTTVDGVQRLLGAWRSKVLQAAVGVIVGELIVTKGLLPATSPTGPTKVAKATKAAKATRATKATKVTGTVGKTMGAVAAQGAALQTAASHTHLSGTTAAATSQAAVPGAAATSTGAVAAASLAGVAAVATLTGAAAAATLIGTGTAASHTIMPGAAAFPTAVPGTTASALPMAAPGTAAAATSHATVGANKVVAASAGKAKAALTGKAIAVTTGKVVAAKLAVVAVVGSAAVVGGGMAIYRVHNQQTADAATISPRPDQASRERVATTPSEAEATADEPETDTPDLVLDDVLTGDAAAEPGPLGAAGRNGVPPTALQRTRHPGSEPRAHDPAVRPQEPTPTSDEQEQEQESSEEPTPRKPLLRLRSRLAFTLEGSNPAAVFRSRNYGQPGTGNAVGFIVPTQSGVTGPKSLALSGAQAVTKLTLAAKNKATGVSQQLTLSGSRSTSCGDFRMNDPSICPDGKEESVLHLTILAADNADVPSGVYVGQLSVNAVGWDDAMFAESLLLDYAITIDLAAVDATPTPRPNTSIATPAPRDDSAGTTPGSDPGAEDVKPSGSDATSAPASTSAPPEPSAPAATSAPPEPSAGS